MTNTQITTVEQMNPFAPANLRNLSATELANIAQYAESFHAEHKSSEYATEAQSRLHAVRSEIARRERIAARYYGTVYKSSTGTTHFVNTWDEPFCGTRADLTPVFGSGNEARATCQRCQIAGDAVNRTGAFAGGGSPARRH